FHIGNLEKGTQQTYELKDKTNGVYAFILDGNVDIEGQALNLRDGFGLWDTERIEISATDDARVLLMEVPMN
ncbi:MAG: pirin family protein, partial [Spirosomataceae bacterium]